jgi:hypothetical protein
MPTDTQIYDANAVSRASEKFLLLVPPDLHSDGMCVSSTPSAQHAVESEGLSLSRQEMITCMHNLMTPHVGQVK